MCSRVGEQEGLFERLKEVIGLTSLGYRFWLIMEEFATSENLFFRVEVNGLFQVVCLITGAS